MRSYDSSIIGGGFFGAYLACLLKEINSSSSVLLLEREQDLLKRTSYANQARVHQGYHYPRSLMTALRSRENYQRFISDFKESIYDEFAEVTFDIDWMQKAWLILGVLWYHEEAAAYL